ncbi:hypothetical protein VPNG_07358 [Cytospora leucostoma]|uniref:RRM domain-containing protein n=1 Tax=Cytospora leucostoma TaxID=1230097 RepID=A0A423WU86_9PEZI|nr:hypothetical protein VPNG_07358 [Cytospora leucostoma]
MASSPAVTTAMADMGRTSRQVRLQLPTVKGASSIESIDGGAALVPRTDHELFAALRSQTQSAHASPATTASDASVAHIPSSQLSDPTHLKSKADHRNGEMELMEKLAQSTLATIPKLNPATAEFRPVAVDKAPAMLGENTRSVDNQKQTSLPVFVSHATGAATGSNTFQIQNGSSFQAAASDGSFVGHNTFQPQTGGFANMTAALQAQNYIPSLTRIESNGMNVFDGANHGGLVGQAVQQSSDATHVVGGGMATGPQNFSLNDTRQQYQNNNVPSGHANNTGFQQPVNGSNGRDGTTFVTYNVNSVQQLPNGMNGPNELAFGVPNGSGAQQTGNGVNGVPMSMPMPMPMANAPGQNGSYSGLNGAAGSFGSAQEQEQLSMSTLQAHLSGSKANIYHQVQTGSGMTATYPQAAVGQPQSYHQSAPMQPQNGLIMQQQQQQQQQPPQHHHQQQQQQQQQHDMNTPMRNVGSGLMGPAGQYTLASSTVWSPGQSSDFTPSQYVVSPKNVGRLGRTEPHNFAPRSSGSITNEPPPRFALQTPVPIQQQVYNNIISPSSAGGDPFTPGGPAPTLNPFNGPALPRVIQPIEQPQNAVVLHDNPVPQHIRSMRSKQLNELTQGPTRRPSLEIALSTDYFPFVDSARNAQPTTTYGVVKLKNIPFSTKRSEIIAFLGRNSKVLNDNQEPVHIIMERVTSKTNDAYVEFMSMQAAVAAVEKHQKTVAAGRLSRLGDRPIEVELSSQSALMKDLFPLAKGIRWEGPIPVILQDHPTEPWNCFKGFVTEEESPFSRDCPQRPFECMISTLRKFPWYKTDCITIKQRHSVYNACAKLLRLLQFAIKEQKNDGFLTQQLLKRLWTAAMLCHGFTVAMKDNIAFQVGLPDDRLREFNMPRFANMWVHSYTLAPKPGTPLDILEWYIALIREETNRTVGLQLPNVQAQIHQEGTLTNLYWGFYYKELNLPHGAAFDNMTLAQMADLEFGCIANILSRALSPS